MFQRPLFNSILPPSSPHILRGLFPSARRVSIFRLTLKRATSPGPGELGQGLTEYLVLLLLIAVISIGAARTLGSTIRGKLEMANRHIEDVQLEKRD